MGRILDNRGSIAIKVLSFVLNGPQSVQIARSTSPMDNHDPSNVRA
jgi:hypothetical protein